MAYPGIAFALIVGFAIGAALYFILNDSQSNSRHREEPYFDESPHDFSPPLDRDRRSSCDDPSPSGSGTARKRKEKCVICFEEMNVNSTWASRKLICGHQFHKNCIEKWLDGRKTCPVCRQPS